MFLGALLGGSLLVGVSERPQEPKKRADNVDPYGMGGGEKDSPRLRGGHGLEPKWPSATNEKLDDEARQETGLRARPSRASI